LTRHTCSPMPSLIATDADLTQVRTQDHVQTGCGPDTATLPGPQHLREAAERALKRIHAELVEQHKASGHSAVTRYKRRRSQTEIAARDQWLVCCDRPAMRSEQDR
ncbi:MAG: hypothetical protein J2P36_40200, partial [Ktedonobacteraceae bacterium]|nr:hypothetical protein [Ktedonobacteraceae bacterium]